MNQMASSSKDSAQIATRLRSSPPAYQTRTSRSSALTGAHHSLSEIRRHVRCPKLASRLKQSVLASHDGSGLTAAGDALLSSNRDLHRQHRDLPNLRGKAIPTIRSERIYRVSLDSVEVRPAFTYATHTTTNQAITGGKARYHIGCAEHGSSFEPG